MTHAEDIAYLRAEMSPAVFEQLVHEWAEAVRDARRDEALKPGSGSRWLRWEQELVGGHVAQTRLQPPARTYRKKAG